MSEKRLFATHLLVALAMGQNYAYGIYKQMIDDATGTLIVNERAVYRELPRLIKLNLIEVVDSTAKPVKYCLTTRGRRWLRMEKVNLRVLDQLLQKRL